MYARLLITLLLFGVLAKESHAMTVDDSSRNAFSNPMPGASEEHLAEFFIGNSFFKRNWVEAPGPTTARDGLGPLFNARACSSCHILDGRALAPAGESGMLTEHPGLVIRLSVAGAGSRGEPKPHPAYGEQFNPQGIAGVRPEGTVHVRYVEIPGLYTDGTSYSLRKPNYRFENPGYGPVDPRTRISPRLAPQLIGLGLLEAIPDSALPGRANRVWDAGSNRMVRGRFGWKAESGTLAQQAAAAFAADIGITSTLFPRESCTPAQIACLQAVNGGAPEIDARTLGKVVHYTRLLAVPSPRNQADKDVLKGRFLFNQLQCVVCHVANQRTGTVTGYPELSNKEIHPYTDLLLHDMGPGLADGRAAYDAGPGDWRTPPLWGLGLLETVGEHANYLHDGRARTLAEAILWHDGEAKEARERFRRMSREDRDRLLLFLGSL